MMVRIGDIVKNTLLYSGSEFKVVKFDETLENWLWAECTKSNSSILKIGDSVPMQEDEVMVIKSYEETYETDSFSIGSTVEYAGTNIKFQNAQFEIMDINSKGDIKCQCTKSNAHILKGFIQSFREKSLRVVGNEEVEEVTNDFLTSITNNGIKLLRLDILNAEITNALDNHNKDLFMRLTNEMKELKKTINWDLTYTK